MSIIPPPDPRANKDGSVGSVKPAPPKGPVVQMKVRADLTFDRMNYQGVEYWVVKEPLGQKYYQFPPHVFYLLRELDGLKTIDQLQDDYHEKYAPKRITRQDLQQLLTRFHQDGLVTSNTPHQGPELLKRGEKSELMERVGAMANILAIRYKGFDPERILDFLMPYTWWIFTKAAAIGTMILASIALLSVLMNWTHFQSMLPGFDAFFDPRQWYLFVIVLCGTKVVHEFGHGLSCKRLGGECHEIGFMLLVLTPCLYCNVSDSWRLPNKWHRAAIGAAGMYVEVILATIATFVWWFVQPGFINDIALRVMLISSISTVLFNGNPLLRFDGYYILSDILEIPNLNQKSTKALTTLLGRNWLGLDIPDDQLMPTNRPYSFAMFTVAAFCYRWFVMFSIIFFLMVMLEPYNLESIGIGIAIFSMISMVGMPCYKLFKYMSVPGRMHEVKKVRFFVVLACVVAVIALILMIPVPHYLRCNAVVMPKQFETIWVNESGILKSCLVKPGDEVEAGQTLAQLSNFELNLQLLDAKAAYEEAQGKLQRAEMLQRNGESQPIQSLFTDATKLWKSYDSIVERIDKLTLKSSIAGHVVETPFDNSSSASEELQESMMLPLLYDQHTDASASRGQRFCEVADFSQWYFVVILTEHQIKFVQLDQDVKIKLFSEPGNSYKSKIATIPVETDYSISRREYEASPSASPGGQTRVPDPVVEMVAGYEQANLQYVTRVPLEDTELPLKIGMGGKAKIFVGNRSLGYRLWWWINQNFR